MSGTLTTSDQQYSGNNSQKHIDLLDTGQYKFVCVCDSHQFDQFCEGYSNSVEQSLQLASRKSKTLDTIRKERTSLFVPAFSTNTLIVYCSVKSLRVIFLRL